MNTVETNKLDCAVDTIWNYTKNLEKEYGVKLDDVPVWLGVINSQLNILLNWDQKIDKYINELFALIKKYEDGKSKAFMLESENDLLELADKILVEQEDVINTYIVQTINKREKYASKMEFLETKISENKEKLKNTKSTFIRKMAPSIAGISLATMIAIGGSMATNKTAYTHSTDEHTIEQAYENGAEIEFKNDKAYDVWKYRKILLLGKLLTTFAAAAIVSATFPERGTISDFKEEYEYKTVEMKILAAEYKKATQMGNMLEKEVNDTKVNRALLVK